MDDFDAVSAFRSGESGYSEEHGWCVRLILNGEFVSRGCIGFPSKAEAQQWLATTVKLNKTGKFYKGYSIKDAGVYFAGKKKN